MSGPFGVNSRQARIASLAVKTAERPEATMQTAAQIKKTGIGLIPVNRSQRRFEAKQKRKSA